MDRRLSNGMLPAGVQSIFVRARAKPEREHLLQQIITNSLLGVEMTIFEGSAKSVHSP